jgi:hypothetical protein
VIAPTNSTWRAGDATAGGAASALSRRKAEPIIRCVGVMGPLNVEICTNVHEELFFKPLRWRSVRAEVNTR